MKTYMMIVLLLVVLLLCGCNPGTSGESIPSDNHSSTNDQENNQSTSSEDADNTNPVDTDVLADLTARFSEHGSAYNMALTSDYNDSGKVNLLMFFYQGFDDESRDATDEEWALLKNLPGFNSNMDLYRLPADKMNAVLTDVFGITLNEMDSVAFEGLTYLETTSCYYFMTTGTNYAQEFAVVNSGVYEDGTIRITYSAAFTDIHIVTLQPTDNGHIIVSNVAA